MAAILSRGRWVKNINFITEYCLSWSCAGIGVPANLAKMLLTDRSAIAARVALEALPICGKTTQFFNLSRELFAGNSPGVVTSNPAASISPDFKASCRSFWLSQRPRLTLINTTLFFIFTKVALLKIPCVSGGVSAQQTMMKSDCSRSVSSGTCSAGRSVVTFSPPT